jgi:ABC-type nitrate/sulfonate/bicarbonate transport system substrate-binding protein
MPKAIQPNPNPRLRLGFVPLTDCAPLIVAQELGLFQQYGLRVTLHRELGWATIRDKIIFGELDAAHAVAAMPVAATLGLSSIRCECVTGLVLNLHGNAITLSSELRKRGVRDGASLREAVVAARKETTFTFAAVAPYSSHLFLLRSWLAAHGIAPGKDVRLVIVPPPQMAANLKAGHLDGFCVGEPWNSVAVQMKVGWCAAASAELAPGHPEKVLMVRRVFAEKRAEEHLALLAALLDACEFCAQPENYGQVISWLSRPQYVGVTPSALRPGISGEFDFGHGTIRTVQEFAKFYGDDANEPSADKAAWVLEQMRAIAPIGTELSSLNAELGRRVFRSDLYSEAMRLRGSARISQCQIKEELINSN